MKSLLAPAGLGLLALLAAAPAQAHGIWVAERHGDLAVVYGHGGTDEAYDPAKLESVAAFDAAGKSLSIETRSQESHVLLEAPADVALVTAVFDNGFWTKRADGSWVNEPKSAVDGAQQSGHYLKYTTAVLAPLTAPVEPAGMALEIVPEVDPTTLDMADTLPIRVLQDGAPAADVEVIAEYTTDSDNSSIRTDEDGRAEIVVRNQGLNVVAASLAVPTPDSPDADQRGLFATLSFNLDYHAE